MPEISQTFLSFLFVKLAKRLCPLDEFSQESINYITQKRRTFARQFHHKIRDPILVKNLT
jgi:hypothetical protein